MARSYEILDQVTQFPEVGTITCLVLSQVPIDNAIRQVVSGVNFCLTIADPRKPDCPLIAVSDEFEELSGYQRDELLGKNMRCMNHLCHNDSEVIRGLRVSCETGAPFTAVIVNRKKNGRLFHNLLDLRGLTVAADRTGEEVWFLVGIAADVTGLGDADIPDDHMNDLRKVTSLLRKQLAVELSATAIAGVHDGDTADVLPECCELLPHPRWRPGEPLASRWPRKAGKAGESPSWTLNTLPEMPESAVADLQHVQGGGVPAEEISVGVRPSLFSSLRGGLEISAQQHSQSEDSIAESQLLMAGRLQGAIWALLGAATIAGFLSLTLRFKNRSLP